jgi:hypothetical protein
MKQKVQQQDLTKGMDLTSEAAALCPVAARRRREPNSVRNAASRCGPRASARAAVLSVEAGTKFCPECGNKMV